jgi:hypothetical protein
MEELYLIMMEQYTFDANRGVTLTGDGTFKVNNSSTITVPGSNYWIQVL